MRIGELVVLYLLCGGGTAAAWLVTRGASASRVLDAALLFSLWPIYAPFLWLRVDAKSEPKSGESRVARLDDRISLAEARIGEIDRLLERPEFAALEAAAKATELRSNGEHGLASIVEARIENIRRLVALRERSRRELDHVGELMRQLRVQQELVRLGASESGAEDLLLELSARVEGLDRILADDELTPSRQVEAIGR
jgi:hypothetical protein